MNIFATSYDPYVAARFLDDKRLIKMILESTQILCTVLYLRDKVTKIENKYLLKGTNLELLKPTHINHPCVKWTFKNWENFQWLGVYVQKLCEEYTLRYGRLHKYNKLLKLLFGKIPLINKNLTSNFGFTNCTSFKNNKNIPLAYRLYLKEKWNKDKYKPKINRKEFDFSYLGKIGIYNNEVFIITDIEKDNVVEISRIRKNVWIKSFINKNGLQQIKFLNNLGQNIFLDLFLNFDGISTL